MPGRDEINRAIDLAVFDAGRMRVDDLVGKVANSLEADTVEVRGIIEDRMDERSLRHENRSVVWLPGGP